MVRAKFTVTAIERYSSNPSQARIKLSPVFKSTRGIDGNDCPENFIFGKYTPSGECWMMIENPDAVSQFELGKPYYVDFTPADN